MGNFGGPIHPGEIIADELEYIGMTAASLAEKIAVLKNRLYIIINEERSITADTALGFGRIFGTSPDFWLNPEKSYGLDVVRQKSGDSIKSIIPYRGFVQAKIGRLSLR